MFKAKAYTNTHQKHRPSRSKYTLTRCFAQHTYVLPNGYKVEMVKKGDNSVFRAKKAGTSAANQYTKWHLKGTVAEGSFLHKPATVSGGGKSEISKRIEVMLQSSLSVCVVVSVCMLVRLYIYI